MKMLTSEKILYATIALLTIVMFLPGCEKQRVTDDGIKLTDDQFYETELLFTKDGCKVYRFKDNFSYRYFTKCENVSASSVSYTVPAGKSQRPEHNQTDYPSQWLTFTPAKNLYVLH